jgi:hypothetical protein
VKKKSRETIEAERFLGRYAKQGEIVLNRLEEIQQWRDLACRITANMDGERVQRTATKSPMEQAVELCDEAQRELVDDVRRLRAEQKKVTDVIESVENPTYYRVLHDMYVKGKTHEEIAEKYGHDYTWSTTMVGRAKTKVWKLLHQ